MIMYKEQLNLTLIIGAIAILGGMFAPELLDKIGIALPIIWFVGVIVITIYKRPK